MLHEKVLDVQAVRELDRRTIHELGVPGRLLMEVAGFGAFSFLLAQRIPALRTLGALVLAGKGNNGGDGFVLSRFLGSCGVPVRVLAIQPDPGALPRGDARANAELLAAYGIPLEPLERGRLAEALQAPPAVVVDALLGTGLSGDLRAPFDWIIDAVNAAGHPVLALDIPSGLCGDTGRVLGTASVARWTATFGAIKTGMLQGEGRRHCGTIHLVPLPFPSSGPE